MWKLVKYVSLSIIFKPIWGTPSRNIQKKPGISLMVLCSPGHLGKAHTSHFLRVTFPSQVIHGFGCLISASYELTISI